MGRRKSKRKPPSKKKLTGPMDTQFTCPFCNHEKSCEVEMSPVSVVDLQESVGEVKFNISMAKDRQRNTGIISCHVCLEDFQTPITYLSEAVDVYSDWIDACEQANT